MKLIAIIVATVISSSAVAAPMIGQLPEGPDGSIASRELLAQEKRIATGVSQIKQTIEALGVAIRRKRVDVRRALSDLRIAKSRSSIVGLPMDERWRVIVGVGEKSDLARKHLLADMAFDLEWHDYRAMMRARAFLKQMLHDLERR